MNLRVISRNVGYALLVSALFMFLSVFVSIMDGHDSAFAPLLVSALITLVVGAFPLIFVRRSSTLTLKDGYLTIFLSWLLSFIFGMLPYALWGGPFSLANAWFESVSGFTTTGATILDNIEALPRSLLFWRSATHFIGGLGVVVFLLLIIPNSSPVKLRLTSMELSSLSKDSYSVRANRTVYIFAYVYLGLAVLAFLSYMLAGMSPFDAVCHAFSVSATGGFSTRNLSIAAFDSRVIELLTMVFMLLSSLHFGLVFLTFATRSIKPLKNPVLRFYLVSLVVLSFLVGLSLKVQGVEQSLGKAMWNGAFQTISVASTSGFAITDNAAWPMLPCILLMFAAFMCGCAGSTTGGVKADRILVLLKSVGRQINKILHPSSVNEIKLGSRIIRDDDVSPHLLYIAMYCGILAVSTLLAILFGANTSAAFSGSLSSLGNVGPAIRELGFMGSFNSVPSLAKLVYSLDMFLGRVEIYPVLAVVAMIFDRRRNQL
ncbi:MAG: TrkH family potassium uptake protein [Bacteroidales bacterium]|nr:TrkH family potassium uptake protein [Bacteroidales bacterium]